MRHGLPHEHVDRDVVQHVTVVIDDAVLAVGRVWIERHVGDDRELRQLGLDRADRALHETIRIGAFGAVEALLVLSMTGNRATAGMPSSRASGSSLSSRSMLLRETPGIEGTSSLLPSPSRTKTG